MMAGNAAVNHFNTYQLTCNAFGLLCFQDAFRRKILSEFSDPAQACFQGRRGIINIISIEAKAFFQAQGIAGSQANRL